MLDQQCSPGRHSEGCVCSQVSWSVNILIVISGPHTERIETITYAPK